MDDQLQFLPWMVLFLPLVAAGVITLFTLGDARLSAGLSIGAVAVSFIVGGVLFIACQNGGVQLVEFPWTWMDVGALKIEMGLRLDPLSLLMLLIVTGVGGAIHIYSFGYMQNDRATSRFFACLSLFTFSMLGIVLANNFMMMFVFWELVGVSSYLLIGHWYEKPSAADACRKAFLTNRLGDFGFLIGILLIWGILGTVKFDEVAARLVKSPEALGSMASLAGVLIFCGAMGKSAQFPLHVWLPDAMEGPTPVSALIHAATMVAAGVYMLCRVFFLFKVVPAWPESLAFLQGITALDIIAWLGGFTALLAALIAVQQDDIKRILAYSTLSQLGYMVMAVGLAGPTPAMFHLATHAFFKALLFLGAGSVILAVHHEQDIWKMGGLRQRMPATFWTFLVGTLALCGVPPLSGFYSKDAILAQAFNHSKFFFVLAVGVATLTAFYMTRLFVVAFLGKPRNKHAEHAHESPGVIVWPLRVLAFFSVIGGFLGIDALVGSMFVKMEHAHAASVLEQIIGPFKHAPQAAIGGLAATLVGAGLGFLCYRGAAVDPLPARLGPVAAAMRRRFFFDELYAGIIELTHEAIATVADWVDRWLIAGLVVRGTHGSTELAGRALRLLQTGNLQTYALLFVGGVVVVLYFVLIH